MSISGASTPVEDYLRAQTRYLHLFEPGQGENRAAGRPLGEILDGTLDPA